MADSDLVFGSPASGVTTDLVFGADNQAPEPSPVTVSAPLPLTASVRVYQPQPVTVEALADPGVSVHLKITMPVTVSIDFGFPVAVRPVYVSGAARPLVGEATAAWQAGMLLKATAVQRHQSAKPAPAAARTRFQKADAAHAYARTAHQSALPTHSAARGRFQGGVRVVNKALARHQDALRLRNTYGSRFQQATPVAADLTVRHQDGLRDRRNRTAGRWQQGVPKSSRYVGSARSALHLDRTLGGRYQEGMKPPPGIWDRTPVVPPDPDPCYTPDPDLVFKALWDGSPHLVFICDGHDEPNPPDGTVVVPIKRVYVVLNETSLRRVDGDILIPTLSMSMSLDVDSWTWSFSAVLPGQAMADITPSSPGAPVLVEAMINGVPYRMQIERRQRDRSFNRDAFRVSGRGLATVLDRPYAPILNFANTEARTAQQLMNDVLTLNGVGIGWSVDWQAVDWSVPAGLFSHQGTHVSALNEIAEAAGSYIQPHRTAQTFIVLPRYPDLPWDWGDVTPDFEIPSSVATVEGTEWTDKPVYNRVYVSGTTDGILGQVTRAGTDGGLVAPMIVNPLVTTEAAARQLGTPTLADTGPQAMVSLRLPVLPETGVIQPGKYVRYVDGAATMFGLTRSVSVEVGTPEVWQTIEIETHV